jgi:hypothetical protein
LTHQNHAVEPLDVHRITPTPRGKYAKQVGEDAGPAHLRPIQPATTAVERDVAMAMAMAKKQAKQKWMPQRTEDDACGG